MRRVHYPDALPAQYIVPGMLLALVWHGGIFRPSKQTLLLLPEILSVLEFSLSPFMCSFIFLSFSLAFLLCNFCRKLISSSLGLGSSLQVIEAIRFSFSFTLLAYLLHWQSDATCRNMWVMAFSDTWKESHDPVSPAPCPCSFTAILSPSDFASPFFICAAVIKFVL